MKSIEFYAARVFVEGYPKSRHSNYKYILLEGEKELEYEGQMIKLPCYGIEIIREDMENDFVYGIERDSIECMTTLRYKAIQLIKNLYDSCVSPVHLLEIAGEMADEWVSDFDDLLSSYVAQ